MHKDFADAIELILENRLESSLPAGCTSRCEQPIVNWLSDRAARIEIPFRWPDVCSLVANVKHQKVIDLDNVPFGVHRSRPPARMAGRLEEST